MQMLREVRLYGPLRARYGRSHWLAVDTPAEAIRALCALFRGFREALRDHQGPGFRVLVGRGDRAQWRDESTLGLKAGSADLIAIVTVLHGRKRQGWGQVILGAIITVIGYWTGNYGLAQAGIAMMLGGAVSLLTPMPKGGDGAANQDVSQQINGPANVTSAGGPVPVIFGRLMVGSVTISAGLSTDDVALANVDPGAPARPADEPPDWAAGGVGG